MYNIAIIEDEDKAAYILRACLDKFGSANDTMFSVTRFYDATGFLSNYKPIYDIVFMDIVLPKLNGMEAAEKIALSRQGYRAYFCDQYGQLRGKRLRGRRP